MRNIRTNKGITLIALVITIIVLLILAAVSIATLTGENGILTKANTAKNQTIEAEEKEQISLAYSTVIADKLHNNSGNNLTVTANELDKALVDQNADATVETEGDKIKVTFTKSKNVYTVDSGTGKITGMGNGGEEDYNTATDVTDAIAQNKPFETETQITDTANKKVKVPAGFKIAKDSADAIAEGIVIEDATGNQFVWVPVESIEDFHTVEGYESEELQIMLYDCAEPYNNGDATEVSDYEAMRKSVETNKGFYIGRFEAGKDSSENVVVKKGADVYNNVPWRNAMNDIEGTSNTGGKVGAVKLAKEFAEKNKYQGITSTLCYGVQWDATMQFMDSNYLTSNCAENSYVRNSNGRGHYRVSLPTTTGSKPEYAEKNIYDMAGNVREWTMEADKNGGGVSRGGAYYRHGKLEPSSCRHATGYTEDDIGFRLALYL